MAVIGTPNILVILRYFWVEATGRLMRDKRFGYGKDSPIGRIRDLSVVGRTDGGGRVVQVVGRGDPPGVIVERMGSGRVA